MDGLIALIVILGVVSSIFESVSKQKKKKVGSAEARPKEKPKGFFAALEEELKKAEAEERRQREEQLAMSQPKKKKKKPAVPKPVAPQEPRVVTYDAYGEDDLLGQQYRAEQQRKFESSFDKGPVAARAADANYQIQEKSGFRIESLQERYPDPAQQMIVLAEILGKPVSMRR